MKGTDALLCELPPSNLEDFDRLKWIQLTSAGYNQVLNLPILERGIRVTNGLGNFDGPIAQWNIMMMLMWHREMLEQLRNQKGILSGPGQERSSTTCSVRLSASGAMAESLGKRPDSQKPCISRSGS